MIWCQWYFSDECEQGNGPFRTKEDAKEAAGLYGMSLKRDLTNEEICRLRALFADLQ